jgi:hypothetical protein
MASWFLRLQNLAVHFVLLNGDSKHEPEPAAHVQPGILL